MAPIRSLGLLFVVGLGALAPAAGQVNVLTQHNDNSRSGANLNEIALKPSNVNSSQFGLLFKRAVDDQIYTQPLYVSGVNIGGTTHNIVYVGTVNNSVYAFDADDASRSNPYWKVTLGTAPNRSNNGGAWTCGNINGNAGIIGTPAIDVSTQTLYVVTKRVDGTVMKHHLHALDLATGAEKFGGPAQIQGSDFNSAFQLQRPGLLLLNGVVYIAFGSHCDQGTYHGYLFGYDARTLNQVALYNTTPAGTEGAIWQSGQGPAADGDGNIYVITGNGTWDGVKNFGESFLKFSTAGGLTLTDWFTPANWAALNTNDLDLGCSGVLLIPDKRLALGGTKEGKLYVLNMDKLGNVTAGDTGAIQGFQAVTPPPPNTGTNLNRVHGSAIYWASTANGPTVYLWGDSDYGRAFKIVNGKLQTTPSSTTAPHTAPISGTGIPGGILALSASGGTDGVLWANSVYTGSASVTTPGALYAFDANDLSRMLWNSKLNAQDDSGYLAKFVPPTIANGKVYLSSFGSQSTGTGQLCVYGLLSDFALTVTGGTQTVQPGGSVVYRVSVPGGFTGSVNLSTSGLPPGATGVFDSTTLTGAAGSTNLTITLSGSAAAGAYFPAVTGVSGGTTHSTLFHLNIGDVTARLINISTHAFAGSTDGIMTAGTVIQGTTSKTLLVRGVGPELATFGLGNVLSDPVLKVYNSSGVVVASNTRWNTNPNPALVASTSSSAGAFPLTNGSADSALLVTLTPGAYTFQVGSAQNRNGVTMVEAYDAEPQNTAASLINISTSGQVGSGDRAMVAGMVVHGNGIRTILIRGIGPSLARFSIANVVADPQLKVYNDKSVVIATNDNWGTPNTVNGRTVTDEMIRSACSAAGAFSLDEGSKDAAILLSLAPGAYTIELSSVGSSAGTGLVEAYAIGFE